MKKLLKYYKPYSLHILVILVLTFVSVNIDLTLPDYMSKIINNGIVNGDMSYIYEIGLKMLLITLVGCVLNVIVGALASFVAARASFNIRKDMFRKIETVDSKSRSKFSTSTLITRTVNDTAQISGFSVMFLRLFITAPIMGIGGMIKAYNNAPSMVWIIALSFGLLLLLVMMMMIFVVPKFSKRQTLIDKLNSVIRGSVNGILTVRAFNKEELEEEKFDEVNLDVKKMDLFIERVTSLLMPYMKLIMNFTAIAIIYFGAKLIDDSLLGLGDIMAFIQYSMQILVAFILISIIFTTMPRAKVSAGRIAEVLELESNIVNDGTTKLDENINTLEFKDVSFSYDGAEKVLEDLNFKVSKNQTIAFIGSTASGKSSLVNLIPRMYDATSGSVRVNDIDVRDIELTSLRDKIGFTPQKANLFKGTIRSNMKFGNEHITDEKIDECLKTAMAYDFVYSNEEGLDTELSKGGTNLSGGQRQRLCIARTLCSDADVLVFDDSFSALDYKTDKALRAALKTDVKDKIIVVVAQRINTIKHADIIVVLNEGKIDSMGTHKELLEKSSVYKEIALSQLKEEEL